MHVGDRRRELENVEGVGEGDGGSVSSPPTGIPSAVDLRIGAAASWGHCIPIVSYFVHFGYTFMHFVGALLAMAKGNEGPPKSVRPPDGIEPFACRKVVEPSRPNSHASVEA